MRISILFLLLVTILTSCKNKEIIEKVEIKKVNWLLGKWESQTTDGSLTEKWTQLNDSTFEAVSYFIKNKDTLHFENIKLLQKGNTFVYKSIVRGQNDNKAVPFKMTLDTLHKLVFENPKHDYPQKITYTLINKDSLVASISGVDLGKPSSEKFGMKKTQ